MKWLSKLSHLVWPENPAPNTAQGARSPELSRRGRERGRPRRPVAHGVEDITAPVPMFGVSDQLSPPNVQMSNAFRFSQLGKGTSEIQPASCSHRDDPNRGFSSKKGGVKATPHSEEDLQEERRLFGGSKKDPNAVRITPGTLPRKGSGRDLKSFSNFTPRNTLLYSSGRNQIHSFARRHRDKLIRPVSRVQDGAGALHEEQGSQSRKRRRTDDSEASTEGIQLNDNDSINHVESPSSSTPNTFTLPHLSQDFPLTHRGSASQKESTTHEFWDVESRMQDFKGKKPHTLDLTDDEIFTMEAKAQRLGKKTHKSLNRLGDSCLSRRPEQTVRIEVSPIRNLERAGPIGAATNRPADSLAGSFVQTDGQRRDSHIRDSPDELQGEKTVPEAWKAGVKDRLGKTPGDISPTNFSIVKSGRRRTDQMHRNSSKHQRLFCVTIFDNKSLTVEERADLIVNIKSGTFFVRSDDGPWMCTEFSCQKINSIWHGGPRVAVKFPLTSGSMGDIHIQFLSEQEAVEYCSLMGDLNSEVKFKDRGSKWMENMFKRILKERRGNGQLSGLKRESPQDDQMGIPIEPSTLPKRQKLSESLRDSDGTITKNPSDNTLNLHEHSMNGRPVSSPLSHSHPDADTPKSIAIKTYNPPVSSRVTRSQKQRQPTTIDSDHEPSPSPLRDTCKWLKPLVYPPQGKKKAEVEFYDLERLGDGEYLNDNLIGFYLRFLEHHMERNRPDLAARVYFFNSFFFASLTNTPKGRRAINYQVVEKWTRSVDIFSYDYIVVPINENAHWYMAIICNLPALCGTQSDAEHAKLESDHLADDSPHRLGTASLGDRDREQGGKSVLQAGGDGCSVTQTPGQGKEQLLQQVFVSMSLSDNCPETDAEQNDTSLSKEPESPDKNEWPEEGENGPPVSIVQTEEAADISPRSDQLKLLRSGKPRNSGTLLRKLPRKLQYDPKQPFIITFDSLGCSRSATIRALRLYLEEEGKAKRSLTIDSKDIVGMVAQQIPHQPNFSDCGLYLLAYIEKFMRDPDVFISKLVRKEMREYDDWPPMKSRVLRRRLRDFLLKLHDEEERSQRNKTEEGQKLVDAQPLKILLVDELPEDVPQRKPPASDDPAGHKQNPQTDFTPTTTQDNKESVRDAEKEPRQTTPIHSPNKSTQNERQQPPNALATVEDEVVQHSKVKPMLSGILLYADEDSTNHGRITDTPKAPSPHANERVSRIGKGYAASPKTSPTTVGSRGQDHEILDGIE
ncbi:hypothetical protein AJ78_08293 [Emergomyces pasteurianus Ep9510]|uniref:Ubiquitin-like protease family profile domain-containing protein n=1 Tax=Emergomyces pasteurianus Ep9510 TaxID=1447872 RepID=A0A1J9Q6K0_9EURO|nr:hypothetical protein AJ78_08293 [Emergomyces pasteurianus Ep9510]